MGKNSNAHKSLNTLSLDLIREKELDEKREKKRARMEAKLAERRGEMAVEEDEGGGSEPAAKRAASSAAGAASAAAAAGGLAVGALAVADAGGGGSTAVKKTKFGKVKVGSSGAAGKVKLVGIKKKLKAADTSARGAKVKSASAAPIRPSLEFKKRRGIKKPSAIMRKTLKKMAKKGMMDLG